MAFTQPSEGRSDQLLEEILKEQRRTNQLLEQLLHQRGIRPQVVGDPPLGPPPGIIQA
jgi:hypothetical protein